MIPNREKSILATYFAKRVYCIITIFIFILIASMFLLSACNNQPEASISYYDLAIYCPDDSTEYYLSGALPTKWADAIKKIPLRMNYIDDRHIIASRIKQIRSRQALLECIQFGEPFTTSCIILVQPLAMSKATLGKLHDFFQMGGRLIALDNLPAHDRDHNISGEIRRLSLHIWGVLPDINGHIEGGFSMSVNPGVPGKAYALSEVRDLFTVLSWIFGESRLNPTG